MRESIGASWMIGIVAMFVALFSGFLAYAISYTRAFNTKNEIVNLIEHNDGFSTFSGPSGDVKNASDKELVDDGSVEALAYRAIKNLGYNYSLFEDGLKGDANCLIRTDEVDLKGKMMNGYCLVKRCENGDKNKNTTYKVTAFVALKIPVIEIIVKIPVSGETRTISYDVGNFECSNY